MIVVEGPDGAGKTTLLLSLAERLELPVVPKAVSSEMRGLVDLPKYIEEELRRGFGHRLYDRFALISGPIYGAQFNMAPPNDIFKDTVNAIRWQGWLKEIKPLIVYCLPSPDVLWRNLTSSSDETNRDQAKMFMRIYWAYRMQYVERVVKNEDVLRYDYQISSVDEVVYWIERRFADRGLYLKGKDQ